MWLWRGHFGMLWLHAQWLLQSCQMFLISHCMLVFEASRVFVSSLCSSTLSVIWTSKLNSRGFDDQHMMRDYKDISMITRVVHVMITRVLPKFNVCVAAIFQQWVSKMFIIMEQFGGKYLGISWLYNQTWDGKWNRSFFMDHPVAPFHSEVAFLSCFLQVNSKN